MRALLFGALALAAASILFSCASIGNPSGGPRDEDPPVFVSANPPMGSVNIDPSRITLTFNELVNVKDAYSNVVVSPVPSAMPRVSSSGRRIIVNFQDTLIPNTTYTIDFSNSIEDNNESNKLQGFSYIFSTGPELDTLSIGGMVLSSRDSEPMQGILVGAYSNLADSAFTKTKLERIAKTDDRGRFIIRGLKHVPYTVFALDDKDGDYMYANPEEDLAFGGLIITPYSERVETRDTVWNLKTGEVDTVMTRMRTRFLPNDILLRTFNLDKKTQYLVKYERLDSTRLSFQLNSKTDVPPIMKILGIDSLAGRTIREGSLTNDTITYWLRDMKTVRTDSLKAVFQYLKPDSTGKLVNFNDTLNFITNRPKPSKDKEKKKKKDDKIKISAEDSIKAITLAYRINSANTLDMFSPLMIEYDTPLEKLDSTAFHLLVKVDTVYRPVPKPALLAMRDSLSPRTYKIEYPWEYGTDYRLVIDTLAATGIYGKPTRPLSYDFKIKPENEYCSLTFNIVNFGDTPAFVELLSTSDDVKRSAVVEDGSVFFPFLTPGKYYARIIEDFNGNGIYDPGDYSRKIQPDMAYYYPKVINIKKNWDKSETWDVFSTAIDLQKPEAIKKNKSEAEKNARSKKKTQEDDEDDELFDPNRNPFDPNDRNRRNNNRNTLRP